MPLMLILAAQPALWVELSAEPISIAPGGSIALSWTGHGADACTLQVLEDQALEDQALEDQALEDAVVADEAPEGAVLQPIGVQGQKALKLERTSVATVRCERGTEVAYADVRLHVRRPRAPLTGPRRSATVPVGVTGFGGVGNIVGLPDLAQPSLEQVGVLAGVGAIIDPDLGSGGIFGPLRWVIGTPYTLQVLAVPHGSSLVYAGVGARLGLRFKRLELATAATTGGGVGVSAVPAPGLALELASEGRLLARWRQTDALILGAFVGGRIALSGAVGAAGARGLPAMGAFAGVEVLLGLGD